MADLLIDNEFQTLRNRFKKDAEFLLNGVADNDNDEKSRESKEIKPLSRFNRHSVFWIMASVGLTYYTDFFPVLLRDANIKSWWFNIGVALLGVSLALALFSIVYLEWFRGIRQYDVQYPAIAPVTTAAFIAASCSFNIALWPVWSVFTPVILFTQFMGMVMFISLLG
ncbi:transmembrane protein 128-like [Scleropages formosus]|uniref:Transmembrane protein 128 n=1 Tax=Scleropages formosus TaxID=113540 RepID=A0A0P7WIL3_SCLFO|nr:transmembrane protein 128 [Scleropages formosus]KPP61051.1 transmembrane protein 128-like [Scleropages formosus]